MGKEFWGAIVLLTCLLAATLGVAWGMGQIHETAAKALEQAAEYAQSGDMEQAQMLFQQSRHCWQRYQKLSATVADHSPMDEIAKLFAEAEVYARQQETAHFAADCVQLSSMVRAIAEAHQFTWWNLL